MYIPDAFRMEDLAALHAVIAEAPLALFVTVTENGPMASHLPLLLDSDEGPFGTLYGHLARGNPQWSDSMKGQALAVFSGPEAYVTPSWYPAKAEHGKVVPTWNYVAVHARGRPVFFTEEERLREVVTRLTDRHETGRDSPWAVTDAPEKFIRGMLRGIVGFKMPIDQLDGKQKLSQNRSDADRRSVARGLSQSDRPSDEEVARLMAEADC